MKNLQQIRQQIIETNGKIFGVSFVKRTTGEKREMQARLKVTAHLKGGTLGYDAKAHNLVTVFEVSGGKTVGYKAIPLESIYRLKIGGIEYNF